MKKFSGISGILAKNDFKECKIFAGPPKNVNTCVWKNGIKGGKNWTLTYTVRFSGAQTVGNCQVLEFPNGSEFHWKNLGKISKNFQF